MLENSVEKSEGEQSNNKTESELNNVQKDLGEETLENTETESAKTTETDLDNVQKTAENNVENTETESDKTTETDLNNVQKTVENNVDNMEPDSNDKAETDLDNVQKEVAETVENMEPVEKELDSNVQTDMDTEIEKKTDIPNRTIITCSSARHKKNNKQEEENMQMDNTDNRKGKDISANENVHNVQKETDIPSKRMVTRSSAHKAASKLVHKAKIKIKGSWEYVNNERAEHAKMTKCYLCGAQKDTLRALDSHIRRKHKSYRYKCKYCPKKYLTRASRNKHELYHTVGYRFKCKDCKKRFMFESQYQEHRSVHTGENRYICRKKGCGKHYGSTRACNYHERQHNAKPMYCDYHETPKSEKCNQEFYSKQHYQQHYQGLHGDGWNAKCGKHFSWPAQ